MDLVVLFCLCFPGFFTEGSHKHVILLFLLFCLEAHTNLVWIKFKPFSRKPICSTFHLVYHGQDNFWFVIFILMVDSSNIFPTVLAMDYNEQSIIAHRIRMLGENPLRRYRFWCLVVIMSDTQLSIQQSNSNSYFLSFETPTMHYHPEFLANKSWI